MKKLFSHEMLCHRISEMSIATSHVIMQVVKVEVGVICQPKCEQNCSHLRTQIIFKQSGSICHSHFKPTNMKIQFYWGHHFYAFFIALNTKQHMKVKQFQQFLLCWHLKFKYHSTMILHNYTPTTRRIVDDRKKLYQTTPMPGAPVNRNKRGAIHMLH